MQIYRDAGVADPSSTLDHDQFVALLTRIDAGLRALPATAQARAEPRMPLPPPPLLLLLLLLLLL